MLLRAWIWLSVAVLAISLVVHLSTLAGINPMAVSRHVMFIHVAIFPPFIAAIFYGSRVTKKAGLSQKQLFEHAPRWMRRSLTVFGFYALINFALFMVLMREGSPSRRDGKYVLRNRGTVVREISQAEYHRRQGYVVRGFSGHWMLFSTAAMTLLSGVAAYRKTEPRPDHFESISSIRR